MKCVKTNCPKKGIFVNYEEFAWNHAEICVQKTVKCVKCEQDGINKSQVEEHYGVCPNVEILCECH